MFQFPEFASRSPMYSGRDTPRKEWVSPFGYLRINDRSHLPAAFRSVPRPSSPLGAKASTERPYHAQYHTKTARTQDQTALRPDGRAIPIAQLTQPTGHAHRPLTLPSNPSSLVKEHSPARTPRGVQRHAAVLEAHIAQPGHAKPSRDKPQDTSHHPSRNLIQCSRTIIPNPSHDNHPPRTPEPAGLEANGFEPMTPCLQSRCSTS